MRKKSGEILNLIVHEEKRELCEGIYSLWRIQKLRCWIATAHSTAFTLPARQK